MRLLILLVVASWACAHDAAPDFELDGANFGAHIPSGKFLSTPVIDSHVHLAFWPVADQLSVHGVEAVVDLASPTVVPDGALRVISAGPMMTRPGGYPLDTWGSDGYGVGCLDAACITAAIDDLAAHGAKIVKIAGDDDGLDPALYPAVVAAAHAHGLRVAIHALSDASAMAAATAGVDVLAHTPVQPLRPATIAAWHDRTVISTLSAFGGTQDTIDNLRALHAAGARVLYGTDLGNTRELVSTTEIALMHRAGLSDAEIAEAMTTAPAAFWQFPFAIAPGREATFLVLDRDPRTDATALAHPTAVYVRGKLASCAGC